MNCERVLPAEPGQPIHRILILRGGALGDFILTIPAIRHIRRNAPGAVIVLAGRSAIAELATVFGLADEFISLDDARFAPYFARGVELAPAEREWLRSFDQVISFLHDPDGVFEANLLNNGVGSLHGMSPIIESGHAMDHFLKGLGADSESGATAWLELPVDLAGKGRRLLIEIGAVGSVAAIHPGSGSAGKNWPLNHYIELARRIEDAGRCRVVFTAGEADEAVVEGLERSGCGFPLLRDRTLVEVASVLGCCSCYIGNDSGITHLAAALGVPTIALFGPTDPARWAPRGDHVVVVSAVACGHGTAMDRIRVECEACNRWV